MEVGWAAEDLLVVEQIRDRLDCQKLDVGGTEYGEK